MSKILNTYNRKKISFTKGKGSYLYASNGKKYLDFCAGIAVCSLGHANDYLIRSINKQSKKLWHVSNVFTIPEQEKLAKKRAARSQNVQSGKVVLVAVVAISSESFVMSSSFISSIEIIPLLLSAPSDRLTVDLVVPIISASRE